MQKCANTQRVIFVNPEACQEANYVPRYDGEYELHIFLNLALDYIHVQIALTLENNSPLPLDTMTGAPSFATMFKRKIPSSAGNSKHNRPAVSSRLLTLLIGLR
jgi:hypothetical protein